MERFVSNDAKDTARLASDLAKRMRGGEVLALYGDLGAGKTTFAQAFARALGVKERVQSPTFILMHEHRLKKKNGPTYFLHADAYRADAPQFRAIGFGDYLGRPDTVVLVEWADRIEKLLPKRRTRVRFRHAGGDRRAISIAG